MLTAEELERLAYINGHTALAEAAEAADWPIQRHASPQQVLAVAALRREAMEPKQDA